jgi:hypothetical protein
VLASPNLFNGIYWRDTATLDGWQHSTPYPFEFVTNNNDPFFQTGDGSVVLDLNYFPGQNSTIYQDFSGLTAGATYRLAFDASQFTGANGQVYTGTVEAWWNGVKVASLTPGVAMVTTMVGVEAASIGTGLDGANRLEFREVGNSADGVGTMLDNVRLNATMGTVTILPGSGPNLIVNGSFENLATANDNGSTSYVGTSNPFFGVNWRDTPTLFGWQRTTPFQFELVNHNSVFSGSHRFGHLGYGSRGGRAEQHHLSGHCRPDGGQHLSPDVRCREVHELHSYARGVVERREGRDRDARWTCVYHHGRRPRGIGERHRCRRCAASRVP